MFQGLAIALAAASWAAADDRELAAPIVAMIENAERLQSGQYAASGTLSETRYEEDRDGRRGRSTTREFDVRIEADFDFASSRTSFRRSHFQTSPEASLELRESHRWYVNVPGETIVLRGSGLGREVSIYPPRSPLDLWPGQRHQPDMAVFDPRSVGWAGWEWQSGTMESIAANHLESPDLQIVDEGNGLHRAEKRRLDPETTRADGSSTVSILTWWLDEEQGFQPIRFTAQFAKVDANGEVVRLQEPVDEIAASWRQQNDVWVIESLFIIYTRAPDYTMQLSFDWKNVNEPVPDERFDWTTWRFPQEYQSLVDLRLGLDRPVMLANNNGPPYEAALPPLSDHGPHRNVLLLTNVVLAGLFAGWLVGRRKWAN